jgi:hypothetical protein
LRNVADPLYPYLNLPIVHGLNDDGQVVGELGKQPGSDLYTSCIDFRVDCEPFIYKAGNFQLLGNDPGMIKTGEAINNAGDVVGRSRGAGGFLYIDGEYRFIDALPLGINNRGQVVGVSSTIGKSPDPYGDLIVLDLHGFVLTISEPGSLMFVAMGAISVMLFSRYRR